MPSFKIQGGRSLSGTIIPQGAKNEALQILCAVLLTAEPVTIHNLPDIVDVNNLIALLEAMGVKVEVQSVTMEGRSIRFTADQVNLDYLHTDDFTKRASGLRGSVMILGPLLGRYGQARIPRPGGDKIGRRRLDTHFLGLERLGAVFTYDPESAYYSIDGKGLSGSYILLDEASVTGTANVLMAAALAKGQTTIYNAACEPYLQQLAAMLVRMGAHIEGIGSNLLKIEGVERLSGTEHTLLPDMIEIGSFIGMAAMTRSELTIKNCRVDQLGLIPETFRRLGIDVQVRGDDLYIPRQERYEIQSFIDGSTLTVSDAPWPGFTPDLLSIVLVTAIHAEGTVLIHQKMFESRLFFVDKLLDMGAQITLCDPHRAIVIGLGRRVNLRGVRMTSPDIRAGVALLMAALSADGTSVIDNIEQIRRGYQHIETRLQALGADISVIN